MTIRITCVAITAAALAGCAGPSWQHTQITDPATSARQLVIDDGYCTAVSQNSAPVPQVILADGPKTSNFNLQGTTRNTQTGATSYSDYSGQMTTAPAGAAAGFASGMANGMNIGAAIMAGQAQERIHKSCMFAKGWTDTKVAGAATAAAVAPQPVTRTSAPVSGTITRIGIYATPTASWEADCAEFFCFSPRTARVKYTPGLMRKYEKSQ